MPLDRWTEGLVGPLMFSLKHDPQEDEPRLRVIILEAGEEAEAALTQEQHVATGQMGFCYVLWCRQKEILKNKHGIDWKSPEEMNPTVLFD